MPVTSYCKKCGQDVPAGDVCPLCGRSLPKSALRTAWCMHRRPAADWLSWNAAARIILPAMLVMFVFVLLLEGISGGLDAVSAALSGGLISTLLLLLGLIAIIILIILRLQGDSLMDCILDSKGVHVQEYLTDPTPLKLIFRLRSPELMDQVDWESEEPMVLVSQKEIAWRDIARVQLWPEKQLILLYAPAWWMRTAIYATPIAWDGALEFIHTKIGKKKNVILPAALTTQYRAAMPVQQEAEPVYVEPIYEQPSLLDDMPPTATEPITGSDMPADIPADMPEKSE